MRLTLHLVWAGVFVLVFLASCRRRMAQGTILWAVGVSCYVGERDMQVMACALDMHALPPFSRPAFFGCWSRSDLGCYRASGSFLGPLL